MNQYEKTLDIFKNQVAQSEKSRTPFLFAISGMSSAGKDFILEHLRNTKDFQSANMIKLITDSARPMRPGEVNGVNAYFITPEQFENKLHNDEYAQ
jgi:guanylate kinase